MTNDRDTLTDIPRSPHELTPDKLTQFLRDSGLLSDSRVRRIRTCAASEMSGIIGNTVRLHLDYAGPAEGPPSMIAKFPTGHVERRAYFSALGMYARESYFYRQIAATLALNLPRCYAAIHEPSGQHALLLLEDLAPAQAGDRVAGCTVDVAQLALTAIAQLHTTWWDSPQLERLDWMQSYNQAAFETQFHKSWTIFRTRFADRISPDLMSLGNALNHNLGKLSRLWQPPVTLIHRDYNLDNLLFKRDASGDDVLYIIDWQLVRPGRAVFDVATFLCWNLLPDVRRTAEHRLLEHYHRTLIEASIQGYALEQCLADYRLAQLECLARIIAILGSSMVGEAHLLTLLETILERTIAALDDWDVYNLLQSE